MGNEVHYQGLTIAATGKSGKNKPNADGTYTVVLGGLNTFNSEGIWYTMDQSAKLFEKSAPFMTAIQEGTVYSENGHPVRPAGMSDKAWIQRFISLSPQRFTNTIEEVWLDPEYARQFNDKRISKDTVTILGKIKPYGELGHLVKDIVANPKQNLCFSIRCITDLVERRQVRVKIIRGVITFDLVHSGGLLFSKKEFHPSTEALVGMDRTEVLKVFDGMDPEDYAQLTTESENINGLVTSLREELIMPAADDNAIFLGL